MPRRAITPEFYAALVDAFAAHPGNANAARLAAQCDHRTAKRGWSIGWPKLGLRPIAEVMAERQAAARALQAQRQHDAKEAEREAAIRVNEQARLDAGEQLSSDAKLVRMAKQNVLAAQGVAVNLLKSGLRLSATLARRIEAGDADTMSPANIARMLKVIGEYITTANNSAETVVKLERLLLGDPTEIHETRNVHTHVHVQPSEMLEVIERAQAAVHRAKAAGILDVAVVDEFDDAGEGEDDDEPNLLDLPPEPEHPATP